jgi:hypothetical protein
MAWIVERLKVYDLERTRYRDPGWRDGALDAPVGLTRATTPVRAARNRGAAPVPLIIALALTAVLSSPQVRSQNVLCHTDADSIAEAVGRLRGSIDPCGESGQILDVLDRYERCADSRYQICTSAGIERNVFDPGASTSDEWQPATIRWNPELRSELEPTCEADPTQPLRRDPTASLLHELVHAVQDCDGLNPGEHELEAVRIENIYRRAAGLCQRSRYGDDLLPRQMVKLCSGGRCPCSAPDGPLRAVADAPLWSRAETGSSAAADAQPHSTQDSGNRPQ